MKPIGILTVVEDPELGQVFAVVNPEHMYFVTPPVNIPWDWAQLLEQVHQTDGVTPLGIIVDGGPVNP